MRQFTVERRNGQQLVSKTNLPLLSAPNLKRWSEYSGEQYYVFIDESFFRFFDFKHPDGNFVHGAFGIPAMEYAAFVSDIQPLLQEYYSKVPSRYRVTPPEFKSATFYRLDQAFRHKFAETLAATIRKKGGFVAGFFTSNRGFIMREIREDLPHSETEVPSDFAALYDSTVDAMNAEYTGGRQAELVSWLIRQPTSAIAQFLTSFECKFTIVYDPRQKDEDAAVKADTEDFMNTLNRFAEIGMKPGTCIGFRSDKYSHEETGLQIADFVAGEVRRYFRYKPQLLSHEATLKLITPTSVEDIMGYVELGGNTMKMGRFIRLPQQLQTLALKPSDDVLLPYLKNVIASGTLSGVTEYGNLRLIHLFQGMVCDLLD